MKGTSETKRQGSDKRASPKLKLSYFLFLSPHRYGK